MRERPKSPTVSVVLPTYNRGDVIERSLRSVTEQAYEALEIIVVDDGSTDRTSEVVGGFDDPRISFVRLAENRGAAAARNEGIRRARGRLIAFQDSDDEWLPGKLAEHVAVFEADGQRGPDVVYSDMYRVHRDGSREYHRSPDIVPGRLIDRRTGFYGVYGLGIQATVMRRECLGEDFLFDTAFRCFEDLELFIRQSRRFRFHHLHQPLVNYRETAGVSTDLWNEYSARRRLLRLHLPGLVGNHPVFVILEWLRVTRGLRRLRRATRR